MFGTVCDVQPNKKGIWYGKYKATEYCYLFYFCFQWDLQFFVKISEILLPMLHASHSAFAPTGTPVVCVRLSGSVRCVVDDLCNSIPLCRIQGRDRHGIRTSGTYYADENHTVAVVGIVGKVGIGDESVVFAYGVAPLVLLVYDNTRHEFVGS